MSEYGEPWNFCPGLPFVTDNHIRKSDGSMVVCNEENETVVLDAEQMQRIVACVNACAGIPTDLLAKYGIIPNAFDIPLLTAEGDADFDRAVKCSPAL